MAGIIFYPFLLFFGHFMIIHSLELHYSIREEMEPSVIIGNIGQDSNLTQIYPGIQYIFMGSFENFKIEPVSGILSTKKRLDRESLCSYQPTCIQNVRVVATGGAISEPISVSVNILDVNDNSPTFKNTSIAKIISENLPPNTTIQLQAATDSDIGNYSVQSYDIMPDFRDIFALDVIPKIDGTVEVSLRTLVLLDRESRDYFQLFIVAKDGGNPVKTGMLMVNLTVMDVNDNKPIFTQPQYDVIINENITVNQVFLTISASDRDSGDNGDVTYKFGSRQNDPSVSELFGIRTVPVFGGNQGELFVKRPLTVIPEAPYNIIIEAYDNGASRQSSQAVVMITVLDVNNNDPVIDITYVRGTDDALVAENSPNGTVIAFVRVDDADQGINKKATCAIIGTTYFRLETFAENEFKITVSGNLDFESINEHVLTVACSDGGIPKRNASKSFIVQVEDVNDNRPIFINQLYKAKVTENKPRDTYITKVSATDADKDQNGKVTYRLSDLVVNEFYIENNTGIIKSRQSFDRENQTLYSFFVLAVDNGQDHKFTSTATVDIDIEDENDNPPRFTQDHYTFDVVENYRGFVGQVIADDPDGLDNGVVTFRLKDQAPYLPFSMSNDGMLTLSEELDREYQDKYSFDILAVDHGMNQLTSSAKVTVNILDLNDNRPLFKFPNATNYSVSVEYVANADTLVTTLHAVDDDKGNNGTVSYSLISGNEAELFYLDTNSGEMFLKRKIKIYEIKVYELTVAAQDHGTPQQSTHETLFINIKFINVTTIASLQGEGAGQNIIIAIIIGCITALLSILIIVTICILRKMDARKHVYSASSAEHMRIVDLKRGSSNRSSSSRGSNDRIMEYELPRKEVSFSLDEEQENTLSVTFPSTVSTASGLRTFRSNSSLNTQQNGHVPNHGREDSLTESGQQQVYRNASLRIQQQYLQQNGKDKWKMSQQQQPKMSPAAKRNSGHEDSSDMSAASTTDSGNGGSDEDIRHHPPESDGRPGSVSPRQHSTADSAISRDFSANKPSMSTFGYPPGGGMSTFPRNPNGRIVNMHNVRNPNVHTQYSGAKLHRLHSDNVHSQKNQQFIDVPQVPSETSGSRGELYLCDSNLQRANRNNNLTRTYDDTLDDSCVSPRDDDDRATTTSGSYTVNPDELCSEIDELFFKSRGDTVV